MKDYGLTYSVHRPDKLTADAYNVFVCSNITATETGDGFSCHMVQYEKDEYLCLMAEKNASLEQQLTATQLALCELYEEGIALG